MILCISLPRISSAVISSPATGRPISCSLTGLSTCQRFLRCSVPAPVVASLHAGGMMRRVAWIILMLMMTVLPAYSASELPLDKINLPPGFSISIYARNVPGARSMTLSPNGTLFVGTRQEGKVYAILDRNHDNVAEEVLTLAQGLKMPNGVVFHDGALYVAE